MRTLKRTMLAVALAAALPAQAADPAPDLKKELQALKDRIAELEKARPAGGEGGMTAEQLKDFNRIAIKTEALEDSRDANGFKGLKFSGYMDPNYVYNSNKERGTFQFLTPIGKEGYAYDNGYFGTLALDVVKETDSGAKFHLTLYPNRGGADVMGEGGIVHEASVSIPLGGLDNKLFAGQLPDWSGYEYYAPNLYKNVTHNLLFDFTAPAAYTGVGLELLRGKWTLKFMLANMNASVRNVGESVPMFVCRGDYYGGEFWGVGYACAAGYKSNLAADPANPKDSLYLSGEVDLWYTRGDLTVNGQVGMGNQKKAAINGGDAQWISASALAAYKFTQRTEGVLRADFIYNQKNGGGLLDYVVDDPVNGLGRGADSTDPAKGANRYAVTAGVNYALSSNITLKFEGRYDGATKKVFGDKEAIADFIANDSVGADYGVGKYSKSNTTFGSAVVLAF